MNEYASETLPTWNVGAKRTVQGLKLHGNKLKRGTQILCSSVNLAITPGVEAEGEATTYAAKCQPWLRSTMEGFGGGIRRADSERIIGWLNYAAAGVVSATKLLFTVEQVTAMAHSHPKTFAAIVLYPNRAGDLRTSPKNLC